MLAIYFGTQSLQAYVALSWFGQFFRSAGLPADTSGALIAFIAIMPLPVSLLIPFLTQSRGPWVFTLAGPVLFFLTLVGYLGMVLAPASGAWAWAFLIGAGGGAYALALILVGNYSKDSKEAADLSALRRAWATR